MAMKLAAEGLLALGASYSSCSFFRLIQRSWHHRMFAIPSPNLIAPVNGILMGCAPTRCDARLVIRSAITFLEDTHFSLFSISNGYL